MRHTPLLFSRPTASAILLSLVFTLAAFAAIPNPDSLTVTAVRTSTPPKIDGLLDDAVWQSAVPMDKFTQKDPDEFAPPTQNSEVRVLYDDRYLYVGARLYDSAPDSIVGCLVRRDYGIDSDGFWVDLDPLNSKQNGYYFALDPTGSYYDGVLYNDSWDDYSWDGVWDGETSRDSLGWCAEFRIPFTQLRFQKQDTMVWGINFWRWVTRRHETTYLTFAPKNESGFVSRFPRLEGLKDIPTPKYIELLPYGRAKGRFRNVDENDPFNNDAEVEATAGLDVKSGLGANLVLNGTVNPDFGQVEVDPAVVNLTDVETYFDEKRPFFIEGIRNFDFGSGGSSTYNAFHWSDPTFFYSRRIGRVPQGFLPYADYSDTPEGTHILGAAKVTGTVGSDWYIGSLHALTMREYADISVNGEKSDVEIEPASYYTVNRAQKYIRDGFQGIGGILTATNRMFKEEELKSQINSNAFTGGVDGWTFLDRNRKYVLSAYGGFSHMQGTKEHMIAVQRSPWHYFQRPDASHVDVDSQATSLTGFCGRVVFNKERGNWMLHSAAGAITPEFNSNDVGYNSRGDIINGHVDGGYRWTKPTSWTRYASVRLATASNFDFAGNMTQMMIRGLTQIDLPSLNGFNVKYYLYPLETVNTTRTRGGPLTKNRPYWLASSQFYTDTRKPIEFSTYVDYTHTNSKDWSTNPQFTLRFKPASNLNISVTPSLSLNHEETQWVGAFTDPEANTTYGKRYVFANMKYTELAASIRMNWTFTPRLSLQLYTQPLFSSGDYSDFKQLTQPSSYDFRRFPDSDVLYEDGVYAIDPDGSGPAQQFAFYDPDFSFRSLRANVVLRWEYMTGSSLYFVWTHGRQDYEGDGEFDLEHSVDRIIDADPDDIFMIKATYWLSM